MSFVLLLNTFSVTGQYNANEPDQLADRRVDTVTQEYEYYDDLVDSSTTQVGITTEIPTTTTPTTTTTTTTVRSTIRRTNLRPSLYKKKFNRKQFDDNYTDSSDVNAYVQKSRQSQQQQLPINRNAVHELDRAENRRDITEERSDDSNDNYFSRRYARFLFRQRSG